MTFASRALKGWLGAAAVWAIAAFASVPGALAMTVQPVVVDLESSGRSMTQVVTVENSFQTALPVELRVEELAFDAQGALVGTGKDPGDLVIYPPQALIQPGQTQSFRIQYAGDAALARSKHYYITVSQLPVQLPEGASAIQILYDFRVLVSVAPTGAEPALAIAGTGITKGENGKPAPFVDLSNASVVHGYLSKGALTIVQRSAGGGELFRQTMPGPEIQQKIGFGLVGAGQTRRVVLPIILPSGEGSIEAIFTPARR